MIKKGVIFLPLTIIRAFKGVIFYTLKGVISKGVKYYIHKVLNALYKVLNIQSPKVSPETTGFFPLRVEEQKTVCRHDLVLQTDKQQRLFKSSCLCDKSSSTIKLFGLFTSNSFLCVSTVGKTALNSFLDKCIVCGLKTAYKPNLNKDGNEEK